MLTRFVVVVGGGSLINKRSYSRKYSKNLDYRTDSVSDILKAQDWRPACKFSFEILLDIAYR